MEGLITLLNSNSKSFVNFASAMLVQSSVLITALLLLDLFLRKRVRAVFRYWIWMLVLVKLVLPTTLSSPTSPGYWFDMSIFQVQDRISTISGRSGTPNMVVTPAPRATPPEAFVVQPDIEYTYPSPSQQAAITSEKASSVGASGPTIEWQGMVFLGWLAVMLAMLLLLFQRMFFVRGLLAQSAQPSGGMAKALGQGCDRIRLSKQPDLRPSPVATSPSVCGLLRPTILIPQNLVQKVNTEQFMTILLHELIHIKRGDLWVSFSQTVLQIIYFYNPLLWLANSVIRKIREQAVDEAVLVAMGERAEEYPKTLLNISRLTFSRPALSLRLIGVVESKKTLIGRIKHIAGRPFPKTAKLGFVGIIALFVIAAILLPMAKAMSGPPSFTIKGTVTDAETGQPIEGAKVGDQYYKGAKQSTVSSASGNYSYKTWYEEHDIVAQAEGYDSEKKTLTTKLFGKEEERTIHFQLKPKETKEQGKVKPALQSPWKNEYEFVAIFLEAMKNKNWELVDRMSRSGYIDTQDLAKFIATRGFEKTEILSIHSDGQTAAAVTSLLEPGQGKGQDYHLSFIVMKEDESFVLKEIGQVWDGEKKKFINGFLKSYPDAKPVKFYPFCVYGKITDIHEQPMAGVTIRASCGMDTLMPSGETISDEDGNYWLYFGPGILRSIRETDQWGVGFQAATIYAEKDGFYEKNLCQQGNLAMAGDTEYEISVQQMKHFKGVVLPNEPYQLNFVMVHAAKIEGEVIDMEGKTVASVKFNIIGDKLYPSSSVLRNITTDESGNFVVDNVPLQTYWFDKGHSFGGLRTKDLSIDFPTRYVVELRYHEPLVGKATFELLSLEAAAMQDEDEVKKQGRLVFESYFPDDQEAGKKLDEYWENRKKIKLPPEEFFELFQNGLRRCTAQHKSNFLMQHIGGEYIWHKEPDDPRAVDIVYHASFSPEYKYYAVYSGLSVANPKSERVLKRLVDLAMEPHQLGRIIWGVKQSKQEDQFMILLEPYLQGSDPGKRERADVVVRAFRGEIDAGKWEREWNQQQKTERTISEFGDDLPRIKKTFLTGTSSERLEAIKFIRKNLSRNAK